MKIKNILFVILVVGLFLLLISVERVQKEKTGHTVGEMLEEINFKEARNQYLRYQISFYKSPLKVMEEAGKNNLEVIAPQNIYIIELKDEYGKTS